MLTPARLSIAAALLCLLVTSATTAWPGPVHDFEPVAPAAIPETLQPIPPVSVVPNSPRPLADSPAIGTTDAFSGMTTTGLGAKTKNGEGA